MRTLRALLPVLIVIALVLIFAGDASACPNCKEAVASQEGADGAGMRDGYFWSILFMVGMPFGLLSTGALMAFRAVKRGLLPEF